MGIGDVWHLDVDSRIIEVIWRATHVLKKCVLALVSLISLIVLLWHESLLSSLNESLTPLIVAIMVFILLLLDECCLLVDWLPHSLIVGRINVGRLLCLNRESHFVFLCLFLRHCFSFTEHILVMHQNAWRSLSSIIGKERIPIAIEEGGVVIQANSLFFLHDFIESSIGENFSATFCDCFEFKLGWTLEQSTTTYFYRATVMLVGALRSLHTLGRREHSEAKGRFSHHSSVVLAILFIWGAQSIAKEGRSVWTCS